MDHKPKCINKIQNSKPLENQIEENLDDLGYDNDFLDTTTKVQSMKEVMGKLDLIKI